MSIDTYALFNIGIGDGPGQLLCQMSPFNVQATGSRVERVVITTLVDHTYYSRIVLMLPSGKQRSVDSRPSDSLALAMQCEAPLYVARQLAR